MFKHRLRPKHVLVMGLSGVLGLAAMGALLRPHLVRCLLLSPRGNAGLGPGVHTDTPGDPGVVAHQRRILNEARARMEVWLGPLRGRPRFVFCQRAETMQRYSAATHGRARTVRLPGLSVVVLGPEGQSSLYLAHEWTHAELEARLGYRRIEWQIPGWFQEGLCMVVSGDTRFPEGEWRESQKRLGFSLRQMDTLKGFQRLAEQDSFVAYGMAQAEVERWLLHVGPQGLRNLLAALEAGEAFQDAYARMEGPATESVH